MGDDLRHVEDHGARVSGLHALAVDVEPHVEVLRVANLVAGDEPWPDRACAVEALALVPLAGRHLEGAFRDVVHHAVAGDVVERGCLLDIPGLGADHHAELDFPVEFGGIFRLDDVVVRAVDAGRGLHEHDRLRWNRQPGFLGVVGVVEPDGDELADPHVGHAEPRGGVHQRQRLGLVLHEHVQPARRNLLGADVVDDFREVAYAPVGVDQPRLLVARSSVAAELHIVIPPSIG